MNYKKGDIKIGVFDHIPVSQNDQIAVKLLEVNPEPNERDHEDKKGVLPTGTGYKTLNQ